MHLKRCETYFQNRRCIVMLIYEISPFFLGAALSHFSKKILNIYDTLSDSAPFSCAAMVTFIGAYQHGSSPASQQEDRRQEEGGTTLK